MITYNQDLFGYGLVFRVHGSALWKAVLPALFSTGILLLYVYATGFDVNEKSYRNTGYFIHPYVITVYVAFFSFMLTFRLNYAYQRYADGVAAVSQMLSKWLDAATYCAAFHYQSETYDKYRPPTFGKHPQLRNMTRERERDIIMTEEAVLQGVEQKLEQEQLDKKQWWKLLPGSSKKKRQAALNSERPTTSAPKRLRKCISGASPRQLPAPRNFHEQFNLASKSNLNSNLTQSGRHYNLHRSRRSIYSINKALTSDVRSSDPIQIPYPSLFLQEIAHLVSLMAGVALSTLRNDIDGAPSPLREYFPGEPLPPVNPDELSSEIKKEWDSHSPALSALYYVLGLTRNEHRRTLYNAARPFQILGGVSDREIERLQKANGPFAKVSLCSMYVQEFVAREYRHGSTGKIPGPLISRITHVLSDGMQGYNQARKLAYNPFPFPHAQMITFFTIVVLFIFPLLYHTYVNNIFFACVMNFITVLCFLGIHGVARELENPYHNVPNDIPLTTFQAEFNEALVTLYSGFHPDSWWDVDDSLKSSHPDVDTKPTSVDYIHPFKR